MTYWNGTAIALVSAPRLLFTPANQKVTMKFFQKAMALTAVGIVSAAFSLSALAAPVISATVVGNGASTPFALENYGSGGVARKVRGVSEGDFDTLSGVNVSFTGNSGVYSGDLSGQTRSPFRAVGGAATDDHYLNARAGGSVVLAFSSMQTAFNLLWGSIDKDPESYNLLTFAFSGDAGSEVISGAQVFALIAGPKKSGETNVAVMISELDPFNRITITASKEAFEFAAGVPVPEPGSLALLGLGLAGLAAASRRKQKQA